MTNEQKKAIESAEKRFKEEQAERFKEDIYEFLKQEYNSIESLSEKIKKLQEDKHIHEENIKNIKSGNLGAIEKRRKLTDGFALTWTYPPTYPFTGSGWSGDFFNTYVSGTIITTSSGKRYIF